MFTLKDRKLLILPTPTLFEAPARPCSGEPLRMSGWNLASENESWGYHTVKKSWHHGQWRRQDLWTGGAYSRARRNMVGPRNILVNYYKLISQLYEKVKISSVQLRIASFCKLLTFTKKPSYR